MDSLDREIESLRIHLEEAYNTLSKRECEVVELRQNFDEELRKANSELQNLREQYDLLLTSHHKLSKLNHELEAKLLEAIEQRNCESKTRSMELEDAHTRRLECERALALVIAERDRFKEDCSFAVNLLQANPNHFLPRDSKDFKGFPPMDSNTHYSDGGICSRPNQGSRFSVYLPTFPPVGLPSLLQLQTVDSDNGSRPHSDSTDSSQMQTQPPSYHMAERSNGYAGQRPGRSVVTDL